MIFHNRKKEIWEQEKSVFYRMKVNLGGKFKMDIKGFMKFMVIMLGIAMFLYVAVPIIQSAQPTAYASKLKIACKNDLFYAMNFNQCESANARPLSMETPK